MNNCIVKITISHSNYYFTAERTVYYRSGMSPDFVTRWLWFFEYLAARIKVANPRRRVELWKGPLSDGILLGADWHEYRRGVMIKTRERKLAKLEQGVVDDDLFHFKSSDNAARCEVLRQELADLKADRFPIPEFPIYINEVKHYIYE